MCVMAQSHAAAMHARMDFPYLDLGRPLARRLGGFLLANPHFCPAIEALI